jgi:very-short-patch-repair endonuclease
LLSHATSARLHGLGLAEARRLHVTIVGRQRRSLESVQVHSISTLAEVDRRQHQGLPLTSPSLTLLDVAGLVSEEELSRAVNEARVLRLANERELATVLERHPTRKGARALRALIAAEAGPALTDSEAERLTLKAMREAGLEPDATQHAIGPYRVDFWFDEEAVAVEVDGYRYHSTPKRFVEDRRRAAWLAAEGVLTFPLTWHDLRDPERSMARLRATLRARRSD